MPPIVLLHGANGAGSVMRPLAEALRPSVVHAPDLLGHGGRPLPAHFDLPALAEDVVAFMDKQRVASALFVGYSFGGYVALYAARHFPARVSGVVALATKYVFDAKAIGHFTHLLDPARLSRPGNPRAAELAATHHPQDWRALTEANRRLFRSFGEHPPLSDEDLRAVAKPALVLSSERDQLVPREESVRLGELLGARVGLTSGPFHPLTAVPPKLVAAAIRNWMQAAIPDAS